MIEDTFVGVTRVMAVSVANLYTQLALVDSQLQTLSNSREVMLTAIAHMEQSAKVIAAAGSKLTMDDGEKMPAVVKPKADTGIQAQEGADKPHDLDEPALHPDPPKDAG